VAFALEGGPVEAVEMAGKENVPVMALAALKSRPGCNLMRLAMEEEVLLKRILHADMMHGLKMHVQDWTVLQEE
jgi:hypothetical protein